MITNRSAPSATVVPILIYQDVGDAIEWLCRAFGFSERLRAERDGVIGHAQLTVAEGAPMLDHIALPRLNTLPNIALHPTAAVSNEWPRVSAAVAALDSRVWPKSADLTRRRHEHDVDCHDPPSQPD